MAWYWVLLIYSGVFLAGVAASCFLDRNVCEKCFSRDCSFVPYDGGYLSCPICNRDEEIWGLQNEMREALEIIEMVADNRKMPHQHEDYHTRLCCLAERANEFLEKYKQEESKNASQRDTEESTGIRRQEKEIDGSEA